MIDVIISYDVSNNRLRKQISDLLLREGCIRVQKSVFWASDFESKERRLLQKMLVELIQNSPERTLSDSVIALRVEHDHSVDAVWWDEVGALEQHLRKSFVKIF